MLCQLDGGGRGAQVLKRARLPQGGHCPSSPHSLCSEPSHSSDPPSHSAQLEQVEAPHSCAHGSQVTELGVQGGLKQLRKCQSRARCEFRLGAAVLVVP